MQWGSRAPEVIAELVRVFTLDADLGGGVADGSAGGVVVRDGPQIGSPSAMEVLYVGWAGGTDQDDVESSLTPEGMTISPDRETVTVRCTAAVLNGASDMTAATARAYELANGAGRVLAVSHTLGAAVLRARIASMALNRDPTDRGAQAAVIFTVVCDAYTLR